MKKGIKKDNYFERNRIIQQTQKYRYNFIDYLYYQGERYNKRYIRSSGNQLITLYWIGFVFLAAPTFLYSSLYRYLGGYLGKSEFNRKSSSNSGDRNFSFSNICCNNTSAQFVVLVEIQKRQGDGHQASLPTKYMEGCDSHMAVVDDSFFISPVIICNL